MQERVAGGEHRKRDGQRRHEPVPDFREFSEQVHVAVSTKPRLSRKQVGQAAALKLPMPSNRVCTMTLPAPHFGNIIPLEDHLKTGPHDPNPKVAVIAKLRADIRKRKLS